jgi:predicted PurR-regulated permease PerM
MKRKAQAAIEYLMMIAIIMIIIFVVVQLIRRTVLNAAQNIQNLTQSIIEELQKTKEEINP